MQPVLNFFKLVRWPNLIIIAISQLAVWYFVNRRFFAGEMPLLQGHLLWLLVISTVTIAAAGYSINDYFDIKIDSINRPGTLIVSNVVSKRKALLIHNVLNIAGIATAGYVSYRVGVWYLVVIQLFTTALLWFYSTHFKRMLVIGNVVVSFLTALSILLLWLFEPALYSYMKEGSLLEDARINPVHLIIGIAFFAFMLNWMREIVKDMEDLKGDAEQGCRTYPIIYGLKKSSNFVLTLGTITILVLMIAVSYFFIHNRWMDAVLVLLLPILGIWIVCLRLPKLSTSAHYAKMSRLLKLVMLAGLCLLIFLGK